MAEIQSNGCILGQVSSVTARARWGNEQLVDITSETTFFTFGTQMYIFIERDYYASPRATEERWFRGVGLA